MNEMFPICIVNLDTTAGFCIFTAERLVLSAAVAPVGACIMIYNAYSKYRFTYNECCIWLESMQHPYFKSDTLMRRRGLQHDTSVRSMLREKESMLRGVKTVGGNQDPL